MPARGPKTASVGGLIFLSLFSLPFAGFGLMALIKGITFLIRGDYKNGLGLGLFGLVFSGVGFGLLVGAILGFRSQKRAAAFEAARPEEPWLWREDWARGQITASTKGTMRIAWALAAFWNAISSGAFAAFLNSHGRRDAVSYIILIFPLVGLGLVAWAIRETIEWKKFGQSTFKMLPVPGVIGGRLSGAIETSVKIRPAEGFHLRLVCVNRITSGSGKESSTTEYILWEDEKTIVRELLDDDPRRTGIPVSFQIPFEARDSDNYDARNRIIWRLEVRAKVPGVGYAAIFEVPIFRTAESTEASAPDTDPAQAYEAPKESYKLPPHSGIAIRSLPGGGTEFNFSAARNPGTSLSFTVFFLIWTAFVFVAHFAKSVFFEITFGLTDVVLALVCFNLWFKSSRVTINSRGVRAASLVGRTRIFDAREVAGFETKGGMRSGQKMFYSLQLRTNGGKKTTIASYIPGRAEAEWLAAEMSRVVKLDNSVPPSSIGP